MATMSSDHRTTLSADQVLSNVARAEGLAQALAQPLVTPTNEKGVRDVASEIVTLLEGVRETLLRGIPDVG